MLTGAFAQRDAAALSRLQQNLPAANAWLASHPKERAGLVGALQKYVNGEDANSGNVKSWLMKAGLNGQDLSQCSITSNLAFSQRNAKKPAANSITLTVQRIKPTTFPPFMLRIEVN